MMKTLLVPLCVLLCASSLIAEEFPNRPYFGINLDGPADWCPVVLFADLMKQARPWMFKSQDEAEKPELDALGNWKPVAGRKPFTIVALPDARIPGGTYVVTWKGKGKVGIQGRLKEGKILKQEANRLEFEIPADSGISLEIAESDPADPVRDVQCWLPGTEDQKSPFNPAFKKFLPVFGTIRFMDWMHTNSSHQKEWATRPVPEQQTFRNRARLGVPVEWLVELANETKSNPWFCMPHLADDDYVRRFATYVKENLDPSLKIYLEYSNEIWNTAPAFQQTKYAHEQGLAMGIPQGKEPSAAFYSKRSLEIWKIWEEIFGGRDRHVRVLAAFAVVPRNAEMKLQYLGDPSLADVLAIAPYAGFSRDIRTGEFDPTGKTAQDLLDIVNSQLDSLVSQAISAHAGIAKKNNLELIAYESGFATGTPTKFHKDKAVAQTFMEVTELPGAEQTMERYLRLWFENGGGLTCIFAYVNRPSVWGAWGNMGAYLAQPDSEAPRRRGILKVAKDPQLMRRGN